MADHIAVLKGAGLEAVETAKQYRSYGQLEIHTQTAVYAPGGQIDPTLSLKSIDINKQLSRQNAADEIGQATILLTAGVYGQAPAVTWLDIISSMDLCVVYASNSGFSNLRTRFIGYIIDIKEVVDTTNAQSPQRYIQIIAQDLMMAFNTELLFNTLKIFYTDTLNSNYAAIQRIFSYMQKSVALTSASAQPGNMPLLSLFAGFLGYTQFNNKLFTLTPSDATHVIIDGMLTALFNPVSYVRNAYYAGPASFTRLITQAFDDTTQFSGAGYFVSAQSGSVYASITQMMNAPFLEFFGDIRSADQIGPSIGIPAPYTGTKTGVAFGPDKATFNLVIRNTPFNTTSGCPGTSANAFNSLPITTVYMKDTSQRNMGPDLTDVVNYYYVYPEGYLSTLQQFQPVLKMIYGALVDAASVSRYGMQALEIPILGYPDSYNPIYISQFRQTLFDWYKDNPKFYKGTLTIEGNQDIRIGTRVQIAGTGLVAYVEGIQESITPFSDYTQQLTLSRGIAPS